MVSRDTAGTALVGGGVALFVVTLLVSAALAPTLGAVADGDESRQTLVGSQGGGPGLHEDGSVYLVSGDEMEWRLADADSYFDVTQLDNGSVMAGFMDSGYTDCGPYDSPCTRTGFRIVEPGDDPEVLAEYSFPVRTRSNSEVHDVEKLSSGEYLVTDMDAERVFTVKDGEVTWQWNASSFYEAPPDPTRTDWLHINDVDVVGENRYLVSVRNANQLLVVERGEGKHDAEVVEVINEDPTPNDGDRRGDPALLERQHNPQWLGDGAVLVADSENDRVVELHRSNESGEWEIAWSLSSAEEVDFRWPRDADRLENGNTLITDSLNSRIVEVNESGATVWSYQTPLVPYEAERLPEGETVGGQRYEADENAGETNEVPVLSLLLRAAKSSYPLPFWLSEVHVLLTLVSLGMVLSGGGLYLSEVVRRRRRT
ncbi:hypothetical protein SAMN04487948_101298 [Halogranum amylolyticum]|uniref:Arylsulfotransferase (ASST) n=1 Tax=Halogranum amylolyticum TaxID=660520 RepID=A0A1H8N458_9EURY|nr:hypothetical protein [Halogranum amylolyticum]SEO24425.1 hypothetical protein SAMN04487948_101298 [Halogranum amylolyticum]